MSDARGPGHRLDSAVFDSDTDIAVLPGPDHAAHAVPLPMTAGSLALVGVGGAGGALLRHTIAAALPTGSAAMLPWATLVVNVSGALLLGALLAALGAQRPRLRLLLGTGFLGGLTTYSALSVETVALVADGRPALALAYAGGSVVLGVLACAVGLLLVNHVRGPGKPPGW